MGTDYFSGINFLLWDGNPAKTTWTCRNISDYYTLQYIHNGHMHLALDDDSNLKKYEAPFVWLMYKDRYFRYGNEDGAMMGHYYVCFKGPRVEKFIESGLYPINLEPPVIPIKDPDKYLEKFLQLLDCLKATPQRIPRAIMVLEDLLFSLHEQDKDKTDSSYHSRTIFKIAELLRVSPEEEWDFESQAEKINISYPHFRMLFRECTGLPPQRFLIDCRLKKAELLLRNTHKSLNEIAEETGITDVYYFCRQFKKRYHISPHQFRLASK